MSEGIGRADLKAGAVNWEKESHGARLQVMTVIHEGLASAAVELALLGIPSQDFQITKAVAQLDHDGTGSGNEIAIDLLVDGTTILDAVIDLILATDAAGDAPEAFDIDETPGADLSLIPKDSVFQAEFTGGGTVTTPAHVAVYIEGYYVD